MTHDIACSRHFILIFTFLSELVECGLVCVISSLCWSRSWRELWWRWFRFHVCNQVSSGIVAQAKSNFPGCLLLFLLIFAHAHLLKTLGILSTNSAQTTNYARHDITLNERKQEIEFFLDGMYVPPEKKVYRHTCKCTFITWAPSTPRVCEQDSRPKQGKCHMHALHGRTHHWLMSEKGSKMNWKWLTYSGTFFLFFCCIFVCLSLFVVSACTSRLS